MKILLLLLPLMLVTSCGSFGDMFNSTKSKGSETLAKAVGKASVKVLKCGTGEPVREDVEAKLKDLFKVKEKTYMSSATSNKGLVESICKSSVQIVLPYLVDLGNKELPTSWVDDGCTLEGIGEDASDLALKLCAKAPK